MLLRWRAVRGSNLSRNNLPFGVAREGRSAFTRVGDGGFGMSLAAETGWCAGEESRLKAGCSQDWLPHKAAPLVAATYVFTLAAPSAGRRLSPRACFFHASVSRWRL